MSDFAQFGLISTLQRLNDSHLEQIERELVELARARPIALVLPCRAADLGEPPLRHIARELAGARFLAEIVMSINGPDVPAPALTPEALFGECAPRMTILWNNPPAELPKTARGKGGNVEAAFRHLIEEGKCAIFATQDSDVASFQRADLARLCYAIAHPQLDYEFAKMYYSRATDRLYGRVSRLFLAPLLQAIVRVAGHLPLIDFLRSFRYPLAGEVTVTRELAMELTLSSGWGLEIGQLCEVFRLVDPRKVCQVEGGAGYDHRHQPANPALIEMAVEIGRELFAHLAAEGITQDALFHAWVTAAYRDEAALALRRSANLALINGLPFDQSAEEQICEEFATALEASR